MKIKIENGMWSWKDKFEGKEYGGVFVHNGETEIELRKRAEKMFEKTLKEIERIRKINEKL